jgi:hypothetical protein
VLGNPALACHGRHDGHQVAQHLVRQRVLGGRHAQVGEVLGEGDRAQRPTFTDEQPAGRLTTLEQDWKTLACQRVKRMGNDQ